MEIYSNGGALGGSFVFAFLFVGVAYMLHSNWAKYEEFLVQMKSQQVILRSLQPGWTWASELFLLPGINMTEPALVGSMCLFRLSHALLAFIIIGVLFDPYDMVKDNLDPLIDDVSRLRKLYHYDFGSSNKISVGLVLILSLFDVTMIQYLPWKSPNPYFSDSGGFPTLSVMQWSISVKIVQSVVSIASQIAFLGAKADLNLPVMEPQGMALFVLNILVAAAGIVVWAYILLTKDTSMRKADGEMKKEEFRQFELPSLEDRPTADVGSFGDVYGDSEAAIAPTLYDNPMMSKNQKNQASSSLSIGSTSSASSTSVQPSISQSVRNTSNSTNTTMSMPSSFYDDGSDGKNDDVVEDPFDSKDFNGDWQDDSDADSDENQGARDGTQGDQGTDAGNMNGLA